MQSIEPRIWVAATPKPPPRPRVAQSGGLSETPAKRRVQVVEDEALVAMQIVDLLQEAGYEAEWSSGSAEDAVEDCRRAAPDLVLMDITLSRGSDGVAAAERIRAQQGIASVFVSANSDRATVDRARRVGVGYVRKPFDPDQLLRAVATALGGLA
jgi:CheY-like chemotaxis protein